MKHRSPARSRPPWAPATLVAAAAAVALAATPGALAAPAPATRPAGPVRLDELAIRAQSTEYDGAGHVYTARGAVHVEARDLVVDCQEATIYVSDDDDRVRSIVFTGKVVAVRGRSTFRGDRVTYEVASRKLLVQGNTRTRVLLPATGSASIGESLGLGKKGRP